MWTRAGARGHGASRASMRMARLSTPAQRATSPSRWWRGCTRTQVRLKHRGAHVCHVQHPVSALALGAGVLGGAGGAQAPHASHPSCLCRCLACRQSMRFMQGGGCAAQRVPTALSNGSGHRPRTPCSCRACRGVVGGRPLHHAPHAHGGQGGGRVGG